MNLAGMKKSKKDWIGTAVKHPGALHSMLHVPQGEKIPLARIRKASKAGGKLGERARFALNVRK